MSAIDDLAAELGASPRTLRRAIAEGTIRAERPGPRRARLSPGERVYLHSHWALLSSLRRALRTEPNVRLAVLFGSAARGDDDAASDVDLLVALTDESLPRQASLATRLSTLTGREAELAPLSRARRSPVLLAGIVEEGRALVDRDGLWVELRSARDRLRREAERDLRRRRPRALAAVEELPAP